MLDAWFSSQRLLSAQWASKTPGATKGISVSAGYHAEWKRIVAVEEQEEQERQQREYEEEQRRNGSSSQAGYLDAGGWEQDQPQDDYSQQSYSSDDYNDERYRIGGAPSYLQDDFQDDYYAPTAPADYYDSGGSFSPPPYRPQQQYGCPSSWEEQTYDLRKRARFV
ncbi:hypothetical protein JCM8547_001006 [Rhodosporidiobolus lusitaniae]